MSHLLKATLSSDRLIEAQLLLLLQLKSSHGYELIQRLNDADFTIGEVDPATIYRHLRRMDKEELVNSRWETGPSGPGRRLYTITKNGEALLSQWVVNIQEQKEKLSNFLKTYEQHIKL
ncbi:hypothetical protein JCM14036_21750 [Desulfotomaculum defluvii]